MLDDIAVVIRAVKGRRCRQLARLHCQIPCATVSYHAEGRTVPESYADAWKLGLSLNRPWVLQLEDDAYLCPTFKTEATRLIREASFIDRVGLVSLYSGRRIKAGEILPRNPTLELISGSRFLMAQAVAMPSHLVLDHSAFMLDWTEEQGRPLATDTATGQWLKDRGLRCARSWPSLVQHDMADSLYGHTTHPNRMSPSFTAAFGEIN